MYSLGPPHLTKEITLLENVQKFACKICCKSWLMDYDSMLAYLDIPSLQQRRLQLKANLMYQFVHTVLSLRVYYFLIPPPINFSYFTVPYARTNAYYNNFFPHMLRIWNSLPISVVCAPSSLMLKVILSYI